MCYCIFKISDSFRSWPCKILQFVHNKITSYDKIQWETCWEIPHVFLRQVQLALQQMVCGKSLRIRLTASYKIRNDRRLCALYLIC